MAPEPRTQGFTKSGNDTSTDYMSTYITGWKSSDPAGTMETPVLVKAGDSNYNGGREGDFSGINIDPNDNTFWVNDEYSSGSTSHQEIANFSLNKQFFFVVNGQLQIVGDQLGVNYNDSVTLDKNSLGGVYAVFNGESVSFYPGQITSIVVFPDNGNNTVNINSTLAGVPVTIDESGWSGNDTYILAPSTDFLDNIQGAVTITGGTGTNTLTVDDQSDPYSDTYTIATGSVQRDASALISYQNLSSVTVNGSSTANTKYVINSTAASTPVTVNAGNGANTFVMTPASDFLDNIQGAVTLNAGTGSNTLTVDDQNDPYNGDTYNIGVGSVQRNNEALISYGGTFSSVTVNGSSTNNITYNINSTAASTPLTVNAGNGANTFVMTPASDFLDNIQGAVTLNAGTGSNTLTVDDQNDTINGDTYTIGVGSIQRTREALISYGGTFSSVTVNGSSTNNITYDINSTAASTPLTVNAGNGNNAFVMTPSTDFLDWIQGAVTLNAGTGSNTLTVDDQSDYYPDAYTITSNSVQRTAEALISYGHLSSVTINGGSTANITYDINSTAASTPLTVNAGNGANTFVMTPASDFLDHIQGAVTLNAGTGGNTLTVDDQSDPYGDTYTIGVGSIQRTAEALISYGGTFSSVTVNGSSAANITYNINSTAASTPLTVNAGNGANVFNLTPTSENLGNLAGAVIINGSSASTVNVDDQLNAAAATYTVTSTTVSRSGFGGLTYSGLGSLTLNGGSHADAYNVLSTASGSAVTVNGGVGSDTFTLGSGNSLSGIQGALTVNGGGGTNTLNANDSSSASGQTYSLSSTKLTGTDFANITYASMHALTITASGSDLFIILAPAPTATVTVHGGGGTNVLVGPNATSSWTISGANSGKLGNVTWDSFQNLGGGSGNDTFTFTSTGSLSGFLNGGTGTNKIIYPTSSTYLVTVTLASNSSGLATAIGGGFSNTELMAGSTDTSNTLTGPNLVNYWTLTAANAGKVNTFAFTGMANLVGGTNVDDFKFSGSGHVVSVNGGGAPSGQGDWLDFSSEPSSSTVNVNLATGSANINGGPAIAVAGIQNVVGSAAGTNDLIGDAQGNILIGGSGNNTLTGGSGNSLLIGGSGHGSVTGGSGTDILIAGTTTYSATTTTWAGRDSLMAILAELQSADTFAQKVSDIIHGNNSGGGSDLNGTNKLTWSVSGATVKASTGSFTLNRNAAAAADWFFSQSPSTVNGFVTGTDEHNNNALGVF